MKLRSPGVLMGLVTRLFGCGSGEVYTKKNGEWYFTQDAKHVFYSKFDSNAGQHRPVERSVMLPGADPATFVALESFYAKDAKQAYYDDRVISRNAATFRVLARGYAVADGRVLYDGVVLESADAATFQVLEAGVDSATAQDKSGRFNYGKRISR